MGISMGRCITAIFASLLIAGCSTDDSSGGADGGEGNDGSGGVFADANPPGPDATPPVDATPPPDGAPASLACAGEALPGVVANPPIVISGQVQSIATLAGPEPLSVSAKLTARRILNGNMIVQADSVVGSSANTFSLTDPAGGASPLSAYVVATAPGHVDTYLYPPYDIYEDFTNAIFLMFGEDLWTLVPAVAGVAKEDDTGVIMIIVADCDQAAVGGAQVSIEPSVGTIRYAADNGLPSSSLTQTQSQGIAFIFNVPPGDYTVDAVRDGVSFREHTLSAFADSATTTIVVP